MELWVKVGKEQGTINFEDFWWQTVSKFILKNESGKKGCVHKTLTCVQKKNLLFLRGVGGLEVGINLSDFKKKIMLIFHSKFFFSLPAQDTLSEHDTYLLNPPPQKKKKKGPFWGRGGLVFLDFFLNFWDGNLKFFLAGVQDGGLLFFSFPAT